MTYAITDAEKFLDESGSVVGVKYWADCNRGELIRIKDHEGWAKVFLHKSGVEGVNRLDWPDILWVLNTLGYWRAVLGESEDGEECLFFNGPVEPSAHQRHNMLLLASERQVTPVINITPSQPSRLAIAAINSLISEGVVIA